MLSDLANAHLDTTEGLQAEVRASVARGLTSLAAPRPLLLSEWAAEHFYLSAESSQVEGKWIAYPFQTAILDMFGHDEIETVGVRKSARVGYTKMLLAAVGYFAEHRRRNQVVYQPTDDDSDDFVKTEVDTMLRDVPVMKRVFPQYMRRHKDNTLRQKKFLGSVLHLRGGKAAKNYRRLTVSVVVMDEFDGFDNSVEKEGSPRKLAAKRLEGATFPKFIAGSTPKLKAWSLIEELETLADKVFRYNVPCPHCDELHELKWGGKGKPFGMKWFVDGDTITADQLCPHCGAHYSQADYLRIWSRGRWQAADGTYIDTGCIFRNAHGEEVPPPRHAAVHIWTAYSPQATWEDIVREFIAARIKQKAGDNSFMQAFFNTTLGESWSEAEDKADEHALHRRAEPYPLRRVPLGGLVLVAGVDVQDNRFEVVVYAIGQGEEMWVIDYAVIYANPAKDSDWEDCLDPYLKTVFPHAGGNALGIEAAAIDIGGHFTHQAYAYCRARERRRIFAVQGDNQPNKPIAGKSALQDVNHRGKIVKNGVRVWRVGTDTAKDLLYGRLTVIEPGPGYVHFSTELPLDFYKQITAETRVLARTSTGTVHRWTNINRARNEALDCTVYALFCTHRLGLDKYTEAQWRRLHNDVQPANADLFAAPTVQPTVIAEPYPTEPRPTVTQQDDGPPRAPADSRRPPQLPAPRQVHPSELSSSRVSLANMARFNDRPARR